MEWKTHSSVAPIRTWTLDPIDGTKGYIRNASSQYAICLALLDARHQVVLGLLATPRYRSPEPCIYSAIKGQGAYCVPIHSFSEPARALPRAISVSTGEAPPLFVESVEPEHSQQDFHAQVAEYMGCGCRDGAASTTLRVDSQCKYAMLATGACQIYIRWPRQDRRYIEKIWASRLRCRVQCVSL